jgi:hypothetical protein
LFPGRLVPRSADRAFRNESGSFATSTAIRRADRFKEPSPVGRHISGAQVPKFLDTYLAAEESHFVKSGGVKSNHFGESGGQ